MTLQEPEEKNRLILDEDQEVKFHKQGDKIIGSTGKGHGYFSRAATDDVVELHFDTGGGVSTPLFVTRKLYAKIRDAFIADARATRPKREFLNTPDPREED